jgi:hypothetical protein
LKRQPKLIQNTKSEKEDITLPQPQTPPYPERLQEKKMYTSEKKELLGELKNLCIKIPLLQYLKDVPIFNKYIKEECIRRPERKTKDDPTINVTGQLADLMLGKLIVPKYLDQGLRESLSKCAY